MALARWEDQFFGSIATNMQKRALSDANLSAAKDIFLQIVSDSTGRLERPSLYQKIEGTEAGAVEKIVQVLKKVIEEIKVWRDTSASVRANILKFTQAQNVAGLIAKYAGTPLGLNLDLEKMQMADVENTLGPVLAKLYVIPKGSETQEAEGKRAQMEEIATMLTLTAEVPVSPRDPHLVHAKACQEWLAQVAAPQLSDPTTEQRFVVCTSHVLNHMGAHLQALEATPEGKTPDVAELAKFHAGMSKQLGEVVSIRAHAREAAHLAAAKIIVDGEQQGGNVGQNGAPAIESQSPLTAMPTQTQPPQIAPAPVTQGAATLPPV